ncbi:MAG: BMFP domain-containing protein YqiC [Pseudohongiellaceae bacterium]|jgi:BMFP domain-containing protein YqiC
MNDRIEQFLKQAKHFLPGDNIGKDIEKNLRALASSSFSQLDLISKEEFDTQTEVLMRTREKLEQLEKQFDELKEQIQP